MNKAINRRWRSRQRVGSASTRDGGGAGGVCLLGAFTDLIVSKEANDTAAEFVHSKIREIVRDPAVAEKLLPRDHPFATKRLCVDTGYYATFDRENVDAHRCTRHAD